MKALATSLMLSFALMGGAAQAGGLAPFGDADNVPFQGVYGQDEANAPTRAQVESQLQQAKADGLPTFGDEDNTPFQAVAAGSDSHPQVNAQREQSGPDVAFGDTDNVPFQGVYPSAGNMQEAQADSQVYAR